MNDYQFWTLFGLIAAGFGWMVMWLRSIDSRLNGLEIRVTVLETRMGFIERILEMFGSIKRLKEKTDT